MGIAVYTLEESYETVKEALMASFSFAVQEVDFKFGRSFISKRAKTPFIKRDLGLNEKYEVVHKVYQELWDQHHP
ncbi:MAG TPA: hypothetical protein VE439_10925 [Anaerolineae bacterium]|nr:hypothetical protein [Anaerolineae bacterium]